MTTPQDDRQVGQQPAPVSYSGSMPPPPGGFPAGVPVGPRPKEVDLSFWLWVTSFVLGIVGLIVFLGEFDTIRDTAVQEARRQVQRDGSPLDEAQLQSITNAVLIGGVVIGLLVSAVELLFAMFMRKGRNWARILLTVFGGIGVVSGLYSLTTEAGVQLALTVVSLPVVIGAIVTMFLPAANPWFRPRPTAV